MRLFVSVGTDHHPFDRLVGWADHWAADHPEDEVVIQFGTSTTPRHGRGVQLLDPGTMRAELAAADVVVISCGPGGVMDARDAGTVPVAVARRHGLGEHVDDHQLAFAQLLADQHLAHTAETEPQFRALLEAVSDGREDLRIEPEPDRVPAGVARIGELIDQLVWGTDHPQ